MLTEPVLTEPDKRTRIADARPMPRCCDGHHDWDDLAAHLVKDFTELSPTEVVVQLTLARRAVDLFELDLSDQLQVAELIARSQLAMLAGRADDVARLDPQPHPKRRLDHVRA